MWVPWGQISFFSALGIAEISRFLELSKLSYSKPFYNTLNYASTANIQKDMKFYNLDNKTFETDLSQEWCTVFIHGDTDTLPKQMVTCLDVNTLLVLTFADFAVFDKVRENLYSQQIKLLENSVIFMQFWGFLQHFDGKSTKIYTREN